MEFPLIRNQISPLSFSLTKMICKSLSNFRGLMLSHQTSFAEFTFAKLVFPLTSKLYPKCSLTFAIADFLSIHPPLKPTPPIIAAASPIVSPHPSPRASAPAARRGAHPAAAPAASWPAARRGGMWGGGEGEGQGEGQERGRREREARAGRTRLLPCRPGRQDAYR